MALGGHWGGKDPAPTGCVSGRRDEEAAGAPAPPLQSRHISSCSGHSVLPLARRPLTSAQAGPLLRTRPWSISACPDSIPQLFWRSASSSMQSVLISLPFPQCLFFEAAPVLCLQLSLDLGILWGSWVSVAVLLQIESQV